MVAIYKKLDKNDRFGNVIIKEIYSCENYRQALERIEYLKAKNKNTFISFYTGNIYRQ